MQQNLQMITRQINSHSPSSVKLYNNKFVLLTQNLLPLINFCDAPHVNHWNINLCLIIATIMIDHINKLAQDYANTATSSIRKKK